MHKHSYGWKITCAAAALLAFGSFVRPEPAHAQFGGIVGAMMGGGIRFNLGRGGGGGGGSRHERSSRRDSSDDSSSDKSGSSASNSRNDRVLASLGAPPSSVQTSVLKSVVSSGLLGVVGSTQDLAKVGQTSSKDDDRDWTGRIQRIVDRFKREQDKRITTPGDVTEHAIEQALDAAFKSAKLDTFESFLGENWSAERLRVRILDRVAADLPHLFDGNNRGNAPMQDLNNLIQRAAESVYRRIFEVSELLAANRSSTLFAQRLYQTHGGLVDDQLRELADGMIIKASNAAIGRFEGAMRRDDNGFALRYRAQRIVFDCLSENVERITSSETGIATVGEIKQKIEKTATTECASWLENQFGTQARGLNPQIPMPLRVIWSASGPKDDPSMYSRARGTF
ncbi:MAG TPA: hypothetical protein VGN55_16270 [Xanthobacteraceae bacterium]|jgi:hypothetical protein